MQFKELILANYFFVRGGVYWAIFIRLVMIGKLSFMNIHKLTIPIIFVIKHIGDIMVVR